MLKFHPQRLDYYTKEGDGIKIGNNIYTYHDTYCSLNRIEVRDSRYHRVGLGSEMLKIVSKIAKKHNCSRIEAHVHPYGEFRFSTLDFYKRNGFVIDKNNDATKDLKSHTPKPTM